MGKYGYQGWSGGYGYGGGNKKKRVWTSTSGWESSHFGGFTRLIYDYPYIKLDFKANIGVPQSLRSQHGIYTSEKLIKMYLIKCKDGGLIGHFRKEVVTKKNLIGREKKFEVLYLDNEGVLKTVMSNSKEFAPLFDHYREDILNSTLEIEIPEGGQGQGQGKGEGEGEGEGQGQGNGKGEGEGEKKEGEGQGQGQGEGEKKEGEGQGQGQGEGDSDGDGEDGEDGENGKGESKGKKKSNKGGGWGGSAEKEPDFKELERILGEMQEQKPFESFGRLGADCKPRFITWSEKDLEGYGEHKFTPQERMNADMIIKQLDISFEPKSDEVKNLKLGKLDTSKLAEVPAGNISVYKQTLEDQDTKPFAVCVLADMSGSMQGARLDMQLKVLNSLYLALSEIIPEEDLHIYGHSGSSSEPKIYTFCNPYSPNYAKNIKRYYSIGNTANYDGIVIEQVHKKIREKTDNPVVLISLSDGQPCDSVDDMKKILERARRDQFVTVGVGIGTDYVKNLYNYSRVVYDGKLDQMPMEVAGIVNHVVKTEFK